MKFLSHLFLGLNQLKQAVLHKVSNATQDTEITNEGQIGYNTDEHMVLYHDGSGVRRLATMQDLNALITNATLPPAAFDASTETALPSERRRYIVSADGIVNGVSLQANDVLMPATETPTDNPADWIVIQGNLDKATLAEIAAGVDDIKYLTPAGLKHFRDNVLSADYVNMAGDGIGWDVANGQFFVDLPANSGLGFDANGKLLLKLDDVFSGDATITYAFSNSSGSSAMTGGSSLAYIDHRYVDASGVVKAGGAKPYLCSGSSAINADHLIYSERDNSYLLIPNDRLNYLPFNSFDIGWTVPATGSLSSFTRVYHLGISTLETGIYQSTTLNTPGGTYPLHITIGSYNENAPSDLLEIGDAGLKVKTSRLNNPIANTIATATDTKAYVDLKVQSATSRIAFSTVSTTANTWTDVVHGFNLGAGAESNVFIQLFHQGTPVFAEMEVVDKDTVRVRTTADYTDLKVNLLTAPSA